MRRTLLCIIGLLLFFDLKGQVTTLAGDYKIIDIGNNGIGDYTRSLILLHVMTQGDPIPLNYAIGTISAIRGSTASYNRLDVVNFSTSSAYNGIAASLNCYDIDENNAMWKLKTCLYAGKKYLALDIPYRDSFHDRGFKFLGATASTGENMKCVSYEVNGQPYNQNLISDIQDYVSNMAETHAVAKLNISGTVGIGTPASADYKLAVNGTIHSREVKVDLGFSPWPDYVFKDGYVLPGMDTLKAYINKYKHLPEIPSEAEVAKDGLSLGDMNAKLLKKIEELTLYMIDLKSSNDELAKRVVQLEGKSNKIKR